MVKHYFFLPLYLSHIVHLLIARALGAAVVVVVVVVVSIWALNYRPLLCTCKHNNVRDNGSVNI